MHREFDGFTPSSIAASGRATLVRASRSYPTVARTWGVI
jgi:hypothetical protein